ncbi:MAG: hypothetical protein KGJ89_03205 [Patescibacteria group bacterium]|nr:hypothetical protein [Patescibacteria group bacterium]MDE2015443.1 hypothetical protein [Patescibacteria group bacterium]MDE2226942.1 hypothetical protein [Patescibacteria group bacterium]
MTFIQPPKNKGFLNKIMALLAVSMALGVIWLIVIYNKSVTLDHNISQMNNEFQIIQSQNAELKDEIIKVADTKNSADLISQNNLIQDKNPQYFEINKQWSLASQY